MPPGDDLFHPPAQMVIGPDNRHHYSGPHACIEDGPCPYWAAVKRWTRGRSVEQFAADHASTIDRYLPGATLEIPGDDATWGIHFAVAEPSPGDLPAYKVARVLQRVLGVPVQIGVGDERPV